MKNSYRIGSRILPKGTDGKTIKPRRPDKTRKAFSWMTVTAWKAPHRAENKARRDEA